MGKITRVIWIAIATILIILLIIASSYIYNIYFIHPSDEGSISISCEKDPKTNENVLKEKTIVRNGERVKIEGTNKDCENLF